MIHSLAEIAKRASQAPGEAEARALQGVARIGRDYEQCICGAGEAAFCLALGVQGCRCLAPMMIVKNP